MSHEVFVNMSCNTVKLLHAMSLSVIFDNISIDEIWIPLYRFFRHLAL